MLKCQSTFLAILFSGIPEDKYFLISFFQNTGTEVFSCLRFCLGYKPTIHLFSKGAENIKLLPGASLSGNSKRIFTVLESAFFKTYAVFIGLLGISQLKDLMIIISLVLLKLISSFNELEKSPRTSNK